MNIQERKRHFEDWREQRESQPITRYYLDAYLENIDKDPMLREARAHAAFYAHMPLVMRPGAELAGFMRFREPVYFHYGSGTIVDEGIVRELAERDKGIWDEIAMVRKRAYRAGDPNIYSEAELRSIQSGAAGSTWFSGHFVLDYERILAIGLDGYELEIARYRESNKGRESFYEALGITLASIQLVIQRYAAACRGELSDVLEHVAHRPPETFHQALQLVWMIHMLNGSDSFGRLDYYLDPFYKADVAAGRLDEDRSGELICELIMMIEAVEQIQNMTIGGTDSEGRDFYTSLTKLLIKFTGEMGYKGPNLCLRVTQTMPDEIWNETMNCIASGNGLPALYNDGLYAASLEQQGIPPEVARGYCFAGCSQIMIPGMCNFVNDIGIYNAAKVAELTMHGGLDPLTNVQVGPPTPKAEQCGIFDELLDAYYKQLDYFVDTEVTIHNKEVPYRAACEGYGMRTLFIRGCIENGLGVYEGGARYNNIELEIIGITNAADHLYSVKKAVYDDKLYTMSELIEALTTNFSGFEEMREYLYNEVPKFGNDVEEVDNLRADITRHLYKRFNESPAVLGGVYVPGEVIFVAHEYCGHVTGATADGRYAGSVLADSAGASQGRDKNGPTALMNSVLKLPAEDYLLTSVVLNMRFLPQTLANQRSRNAIQALFSGYFAQGGMQLQVNVCDANTLRAAQKSPELYRSLIVRVGGYSDYFVRLSRELQDEIILRTAQQVV